MLRGAGLNGLAPNGSQFTLLGKRTNPSSPLTGSTAETLIDTLAIPAGIMGANAALFIYSTWEFTGVAGIKTPRIKFGASGAGLAGTAYESAGSVAANLAFSDFRKIVNQNSQSSQRAGAAPGLAGGFGFGSAALTTSTVNTANACEIAFTGQLADAGDSIILSSYHVFLVN